jgi:hypothetical protein
MSLSSVKSETALRSRLFSSSRSFRRVNIGETWYDVDRNFPNAFGVGGLTPGSRGNFGTSGSDGIYGFHAGAQWVPTSALAGPPLFNANQHKITKLFTVGPRLGYAWDRWMIFATGGWASANLKGQ